MYKITIHNRDYQTWTITPPLNININPLSCKLLNDDVFDYDTTIHSIVKKNATIPIPAILILHGNKTYGRENNNNNNNNKLLYKCIPDDVRLPCFLVPYNMKNMGFSKVFENIYVTIRYDNWRDKHPLAKLDNVIGPVSNLENYYEYQLYCKNIHTSIQQFHKDTSLSLKTPIDSIYTSLQDRTMQTVITIDPINTLDYDDGFSILQLDTDTTILSIYISNVTIWLDALNLWNSFSKRISTIYLPDKKRPMLPTILSDGLCSLKKGERRIALVMDLIIRENEIKDVQFCNAIIKVSHNYVYEEPALLNNKTYHALLKQAKSLNQSIYKCISNSHDLVCSFMILMNYYCATELYKHKTGIFRISNKELPKEEIPEEVAQFINIWNCQYICINKDEPDVKLSHSNLKLDVYVHITSPIRRLVDILNIIQLQKIKNIHCQSEQSLQFYEKWIHDIDYINTTMKNIRKVQMDCELLHAYTTLTEKNYEGVIIEKMSRENGMYQYYIYLPVLKLSSRIISTQDYPIYSKHTCCLYIFYEEDKLQRKIRVQFVS